jgi:catechol 2,3-dioxygenase-like lactoylglutathione lyase family enzyme
MDVTIYPELTASDLARAHAWYAEKLHLHPVRHGGDPIVAGLEPAQITSELLYEIGDARFGIYESAHAGQNDATAMRIVVSDFELFREQLLSNGVVFEDYDFGEDFRTVDGVLTSPDGERTSWFKDSEGNIVAIGSSF